MLPKKGILNGLIKQRYETVVPLFDQGIKWYVGAQNPNTVVFEELADINKVNGTIGGVLVNNSFTTQIKSGVGLWNILSLKMGWVDPELFKAKNKVMSNAKPITAEMIPLNTD